MEINSITGFRVREKCGRSILYIRGSDFRWKPYCETENPSVILNLLKSFKYFMEKSGSCYFEEVDRAINTFA